MKKSLSLILAAALFLLAGCGPKNQYTISGTVDPTLNGQKVFMFNMTSAEPSIVDSALVSDGQFTFTGTVDEPWIAMVGNPEAFVVFPVVEPGKIVIADGHCSGTTLNDRYDAFNTRMMTLADEQQATEAFWDLYHENPDNILGLKALDNIIQLASFNLTQLDSVLATASPYIVNHPVIQFNQKMLKSSVGQHYIDIQGVNGKLSDYIDGKFAVVDFYASWCAPCRKAIKEHLNIWWELLGSRGVVVVGVNVFEEGTPDERLAACEKCTADLDITYPVIADTANVSADAYALQGVPTLLLISPDGTILARTSDPLALKSALKSALDATYIDPLPAK